MLSRPLIDPPSAGPPLAPLIVALLCVSLALATGHDSRIAEALAYRRDAIADGEIWRLVTAHVVHLSLRHALLDATGLLLVAWIFGRDRRRLRPLVVAATGLVAVDAGLWCFHPEVDRYVGLSGVLHAVFVAGAVRWLLDRDGPRERRTWGAVLLFGVVAKLALEAGGAPVWLGDAPLDVVTAAHRWGAAGGLAAALAYAAFSRPGDGGAAWRRR